MHVNGFVAAGVQLPVVAVTPFGRLLADIVTACVVPLVFVIVIVCVVWPLW